MISNTQYEEYDYYDEDVQSLEAMHGVDVEDELKEQMLQMVLDEHFGGVSKEEILKLLEENFPESFM